MPHAEMIEHPGNHGIDDGFHRGRTRVERRIGRQQEGSRLEAQFEVPDVDQGQRRLARDQDQLPPLLQHRVGTSKEGIGTQPMGDPAHRSHAARDDHHGIGRGGAMGSDLQIALLMQRGAKGRPLKIPFARLGRIGASMADRPLAAEARADGTCTRGRSARFVGRGAVHAAFVPWVRRPAEWEEARPRRGRWGEWICGPAVVRPPATFPDASGVRAPDRLR